jgi:hypothetical protein
MASTHEEKADKRPRDEEVEEGERPAKRARSTSPPPPAPDPVSAFLKRIVVLTGRFGQYDDKEPLVKYWDPYRCLKGSVRKMLANELKEPSRELVAFLLTGEDLDDVIDPVLSECPRDELGVCEFERVEGCDIDF